MMLDDVYADMRMIYGFLYLVHLGALYIYIRRFHVLMILEIIHSKSGRSFFGVVC